MTENVGKELRKRNIRDNPFDNMLYYSFELTRTLMFASKRYKNIKDNGMQITPEKITALTSGIAQELKTLKGLSDEAVEFCKDTSYVGDAKKAKAIDSLGATILKSEEHLETSKVFNAPCRNDEFERVRLGESSDEYLRLIRLRELAKTAPELKSATEDFLYSLCDILYDEESGDKTSCHKREIIRKYNLTEEDIEYIISLKKRGKHLLVDSASV